MKNYKVLLLAALSSLLPLCTSLAGPHQVLLPEISLPEKEFDLGKIDEGVQVRHVFKIKNIGKRSLYINKTESTCGCTVPTLKKKSIEPGETVDLDVLMDTSMKQGSVSKQITIHSNDPLHRKAIIFLKAQVRSPHADLGNGEQRVAKIFMGRCAACHVEKGKGKIGEDLYIADCSMCHGFRAKGVPGVAPALIPLDYHNKQISDGLKEIVCRGSKTHRSMPGYLKSAGGPLSEAEIDSLLEYLRWKSDLEMKYQVPAEGKSKS